MENKRFIIRIEIKIKLFRFCSDSMFGYETRRFARKESMKTPFLFNSAQLNSVKCKCKGMALSFAGILNTIK